MKQKLTTKERICFTLMFTILCLPGLYCSGYLVIESVEKASGYYPIIPERTIQIRSLRTSYHDQCSKRKRLQSQLHYHKDELNEEINTQIDSQIKHSENVLSNVLTLCNQLSDGNCLVTECRDWNLILDDPVLRSFASPW